MTTTPAYKVLPIIGMITTLVGNEYWLVQEYSTPGRYLVVPYRSRFGDTLYQAAMIQGQWCTLYKSPRVVLATSAEIEYYQNSILVDDGVTVDVPTPEEVTPQDDGTEYTWPTDGDWDALGIDCSNDLD